MAFLSTLCIGCSNFGSFWKLPLVVHQKTRTVVTLTCGESFNSIKYTSNEYKMYHLSSLKFADYSQSRSLRNRKPFWTVYISG